MSCTSEQSKTCFWRDEDTSRSKPKSFKIQPRPSSTTKFMRSSKAIQNKKVMMVSGANFAKSKPKKVSQSVSHNTYEYGTWKKRFNDNILKFIIN